MEAITPNQQLKTYLLYLKIAKGINKKKKESKIKRSSEALVSDRNLSKKKIPAAKKTVNRNRGYLINNNFLLSKTIIRDFSFDVSYQSYQEP